MLPHRLSLLFGAILMLVEPSASLAQTLSPGSRVRVTAPEMSLERQPGQLILFDADSLVLESAGADLGASDAAPVRWVVPRGLLAGVESSQGRRGRGGKGFLIGASVGLAVGLLLTDFGRSTSSCQGSGDYGALCGMVIGGSALGGGFLGLIVGSSARTERWISVPLSVP